MILLLSNTVGSGGRNGRSGSTSVGVNRSSSSGSVAASAGDRNGASGTPTPGSGR